MVEDSTPKPDPNTKLKPLRWTLDQAQIIFIALDKALPKAPTEEEHDKTLALLVTVGKYIDEVTE